MIFEPYQLDIINRALAILISNYDEDDLKKLDYTGPELESEIHNLYETMEMWA